MVAVMTINLPPYLLKALEVYCQDNGISLEQAITEILLHYFKR